MALRIAEDTLLDSEHPEMFDLDMSENIANMKEYLFIEHISELMMYGDRGPNAPIGLLSAGTSIFPCLPCARL